MGQPIPAATTAAFKAIFDRDFVFGPGKESVRDQDIVNAMNLASSVFNPELFDTTLMGTTSESQTCFMYATAHFLATNLQAVGGLSAVNRGAGAKSQGEGIVSGKSVGGVQVSFEWPAAITGSMVLFQMTKTSYGLTYLQVLATKLVGNVSAIAGEVTDQPNVPFF